MSDIHSFQTATQKELSEFRTETVTRTSLDDTLDRLFDRQDRVIEKAHERTEARIAADREAAAAKLESERKEMRSLQRQMTVALICVGLSVVAGFSTVFVALVLAFN